MSIGYFLPPGSWGSGVIALPGVPCAWWPWLGRVSQPAGSLVCWLAGGLSRGPVGSIGRPTHLCVGRLVNSSGSNSRSRSSRSISLLGLRFSWRVSLTPLLGMEDCALAPRPFRGPVSYNALVVTRHAFPLPVCGLVDPGWATDLSWERRVRSRLCLRLLVVTRPGVPTRGHTGLALSRLAI